MPFGTGATGLVDDVLGGHSGPVTSSARSLAISRNSAIRSAIGESIHVLDMVVEDGHFVSGELLKAPQRHKRVEVVVENRNLHHIASLSDLCWLRAIVVCRRDERTHLGHRRDHDRPDPLGPGLRASVVELSYALLEGWSVGGAHRFRGAGSPCG